MTGSDADRSLFTLTGDYPEDSFPLEAECRLLRKEIAVLEGELREIRHLLSSHDHKEEEESEGSKVSVHDLINEMEQEMKKEVTNEVQQKW